MNFFNNQICDKEYNSYSAHKFDNQDFRTSRNSKNLYDFQKNNPFDENIDWKVFTEHYEKGTLNHDYKITYKPALRYLNSMKSAKAEGLMKGKFIEDNKNITCLTKKTNNIHFAEAQETIQRMPTDCKSLKKDATFTSRGFHLFNPKKPSNNNEIHGNIEIEKMILSSNEEKNENATNPKNRKRKNSFLCNNHLFKRSASNKERKKVNFYKKTFCVTAACTAFISTTALITTATVFPPLLPIWLPMLLPVTVASNGIMLFKAKKQLSKLNKHIQNKTERFSINMNAKKQTLKLKSKLFFQKSTFDEHLAKEKNNVGIMWNTDLSMKENDMQTISMENQNKNKSSYTYSNLSTAGDASSVLNNSKKLKKKKRNTHKKEKLVFKLADDSSEEEQKIIFPLHYYQNKALKKYLKVERSCGVILTDNNFKVSRDLNNKHDKETNENNNSSDQYSKQENSEKEDSICKKNMPINFNNFYFEPTTLESVKQTAVEFYDYFKL